MLVRTAIAVAVFAFGATAVIAQSDVIATRQELMKGNDRNGRFLSQVVRGREPFDQAKVDAALAQFIETAQKLPSLFPDNSKTGKTKATPKIWENKADFDAKAAKFGKDATDLRAAAKNVDGLKAGFGQMARNCDNCHEVYRLPD
jgi:cytochrome c556